jgi:hypothetical protein
VGAAPFDFKGAVFLIMNQALLDVAITPSRFRLWVPHPSILRVRFSPDEPSPARPKFSEPASHPSFRAHCGARSLHAGISSVREESLLPFSARPTLLALPALSLEGSLRRVDFKDAIFLHSGRAAITFTRSARFQQSSTALHRFLARIGENFIDAA